MISEKPTKVNTQERSWKLVYRILSPNEIRPEEETQPMSLAACQREARLLRDCIWLDYRLLYRKIINGNTQKEEYAFQRR